MEDTSYVAVVQVACRDWIASGITRFAMYCLTLSSLALTVLIAWHA